MRAELLLVAVQRLGLIIGAHGRRLKYQGVIELLSQFAARVLLPKKKS